LTEIRIVFALISINTNFFLVNAVVVKSDKAFNKRCHL
jgi:hypothetical protein